MKMNRQVIDWEKIFTKQIFDKNLYLKYIEIPYNSIIKRQNSIQNGQKI